MNSRRFFIKPEAIKDGIALLTGEEAHHLRSVLRLGVGETITLFDGTGMRSLARLDSITKNQCTATVLEQSQDPQPKVRVELCQALLKGQKMEFILQKATELGIDAIHPFWSEHGATSKTRPEAREERWLRIALEACKQCNRALPPRIEPPRKLADLFQELPDHDLKLLFWEQEQEQSLTELLAPRLSGVRSLCFLVGPEGGFSKGEVEEASTKGFHPVSLGSRILRAETATLAAAAILQHLLGNLSPSQ